MYTCAWANSILNASSVGTMISNAGKLFHVRIAERKYEFWWLCILENGILNLWSWPLVVLVVTWVRYICHGMAIRWRTIPWVMHFAEKFSFHWKEAIKSYQSKSSIDIVNLLIWVYKIKVIQKKGGWALIICKEFLS